MVIVNVIVTSDECGLERIDSFTNPDEARKLFVELVVHYSDVEDTNSEEADLLREDAEQFVDEGCYEFKDSEEGYCVWLKETSVKM